MLTAVVLYVLTEPHPQNKRRWAWLGLRAGRDLYSSFFDVDAMQKFDAFVESIDNAATHTTRKFEIAGLDPNANASMGIVEMEDGGASLSAGPQEGKGGKPDGNVPSSPPHDPESDMKMEER